MMYLKRTSIIILLISRAFFGFAQTESNTINFNGQDFHSFVIKIDDETAKKFMILENQYAISHANLIDSLNKDLFFLTTASIVDSMCFPLGLFISNGQVINQLNTADGSGNFYLKPNGILVISDSDVSVLGTSDSLVSNEVLWGIQSGPMLIQNDSIHPLFNPNSTSRHVRSGVGMYLNSSGEKFIVFAISNESVNFYEFASFFKNEYNCVNALNLESSRSVMAIPYISNPTDESDSPVCRYLIYDNR